MTPDEKQACTAQHHQVSESDLPLCCPMPEQRIWDAHPRVYLAIEETGRINCPYCGAEYTLKRND